MLELGLLSVQFLLALIEQFLERRLRAYSILGLHDGVLNIDDGYLGVGSRQRCVGEQNEEPDEMRDEP